MYEVTEHNGKVVKRKRQMPCLNLNTPKNKDILLTKRSNKTKTDHKSQTDILKYNNTLTNFNKTDGMTTLDNPPFYKTEAKPRPKSCYKKQEFEMRLNEASLSTEASVFRGRIEDYSIGKEIGKGAYAIVKLAHHKPTGKKMAIKIYEKVKLLDPQKKNSVKREIQILKKLDHLNIVKLYEVIDCVKQVKFVII